MERRHFGRQRPGPAVDLRSVNDVRSLPHFTPFGRRTLQPDRLYLIISPHSLVFGSRAPGVGPVGAFASVSIALISRQRAAPAALHGPVPLGTRAEPAG